MTIGCIVIPVLAVAKLQPKEETYHEYFNYVGKAMCPFMKESLQHMSCILIDLLNAECSESLISPRLRGFPN